MSTEPNSPTLEDRLFNMMWGHYVSGALRTMTDLVVADHLREQSRTATELGCYARSLYRVMRTLATHQMRRNFST